MTRTDPLVYDDSENKLQADILILFVSIVEKQKLALQRIGQPAIDK